MTLTTIMTVGGIGEKAGNNQNNLPNWYFHALDRLFPGQYRLNSVQWRNQYGPFPDLGLTSYDGNLAESIPTLVDAIRRDPNPVAIICYSGGAHLVTLMLEEMAAGKHSDLYITAVLFIANPARCGTPAASTTVDHRLTYDGIVGPRKAFPLRIRVLDLANPADTIACCAKNSPWRTAGVLTRSFSIADPVVWGEQALKWIMSQITSQSLLKLRLLDLFNRNRYSDALKGLRGYVSGVEHRDWYLEERNRESVALLFASIAVPR